MRLYGSLILGLALTGCSADFSSGANKDGDWDTGADNDASTDDNSPGGGGAVDTGVPSENEDDRLSLRPAQTDVFVFVANPERDTVTRVNVGTQEVRTVRVGVRPTVVATTPDNATAVVFNAGSDSVSLVDTATLAVDTLAVRDNLNALSLSPDGKNAVVWHNPKVTDGSPASGGAASFNEISLINVDGASHLALVVGFAPKGVRFTRDGSRAIVFSDASIASLDLSGPTPEPTFIPIADPLNPPNAEEVEIDPAGHYAFVRQTGVDRLTIVDLLTRVVDSVAVGQNPTDLDLTPDGLGAVVVSRTALEVSIFSVADPFAAPRIVAFPDTTPFGSVLIGTDDLAVLFTNASPADRYGTWSLSTDQIDLHPLVKPAVAIARTPSGQSLLVVHDTTDNPDGSTPDPYSDKPAVSLINVADFRTNTIALAAPILGFANSTDGSRGYLTMEDQPFLEVLNYRTLIFDEIALRSNAEFVGVLPDLTPGDGNEPPAWISQTHPLGRMSFYDPDTTELQTITGFELNGAIGGTP